MTEKETKFTPGPWEARVSGDFLSVYQKGSGDPVCDFGLAPTDYWMADHRDEVMGTANLIAAAPEMYEAILAIVNYEASPDFTKRKGLIDRAKAVLSKARGETP